MFLFSVKLYGSFLDIYDKNQLFHYFLSSCMATLLILYNYMYI